MTSSRSSVIRKKWPLLALVLAAIVALILVIWQLQTSPETNDAYVYADTIDVVPEVSGRIVEMPIRDNQRVKKRRPAVPHRPAPLSGDARRCKSPPDHA
ncbi:tripartite multidrug resistance system inner membrane protein [Klebsiella michiganensis]|nr:tripartite multidrug resistance system inner membrane protein [Klebsiella michiganensis]